MFSKAVTIRNSFGLRVSFSPGQLPSLHERGDQGLQAPKGKLQRILELLRSLAGLVAEKLRHWPWKYTKLH